jgi:hypothetical protein
MVAGLLICVVLGHKWRVDESTEAEPVLCCDRCGRKTLAPAGSAFENRVGAEATRDRALGPMGRR